MPLPSFKLLAADPGAVWSFDFTSSGGAHRHHLAVALQVVYHERRLEEADTVLKVIAIPDQWPFPTSEGEVSCLGSSR
jgi:hypothetical protein